MDNEQLHDYLGSNQNQTIALPPPVNTVVAVAVTPYNGFGCRDTLYTAIKVGTGPTPNAGAPKVICKGDYVQIGTGPALQGHTYLWTPGNQVTPTIIVSPTVATNYILSETIDTSGCTGKDTVTVTPVTVDTSLRVTGNTLFWRGQAVNVRDGKHRLHRHQVVSKRYANNRGKFKCANGNSSRHLSCHHQ